jgi:hypothetical protein
VRLQRARSTADQLVASPTAAAPRARNGTSRQSLAVRHEAARPDTGAGRSGIVLHRQATACNDMVRRARHRWRTPG